MDVLYNGYYNRLSIG